MQDLILVKALKDFFTGKFLFLSLAPFLVPVLVLGGFFLYGSSEFLVMLEEGSVSGDFTYVDESAYPIFAYLLGFAVFHWIVMTLFVVFGTFGVVLLSLVIAIITVGLLTPYIVKLVRKRHYPYIEPATEDSLLFSMWSIFKIFLKFLFLFLCTLPFLILPFVNFMIFQLPFFYLFYKMMMYDMTASGVSIDAEQVIRENRIYLFIIMAFFFFVSIIPMIGLLMQVFIVTYLSHFILTNSKVGVAVSNSKPEENN